MKTIYPEGVDGEVSRGEAEIISRLAFSVSDLPGVALEIGTLSGGTTNNIAANFPGEIVTVDLPKGTKPKLHHEWPDDKYLEAEKKFLPEYASRIKQCWIDSVDLVFDEGYQIAFAFIDGCHTEEYAINDFEKVEPCMVEGGVVLFHDYNSGCWPGVTTGIKKLFEKYPHHLWEHILGSSIVCCVIMRPQKSV